jgi:hypothetical protein
MNTQQKTSIPKSILGSKQRLLRSNKNHSLLASNYVNAHTMRDIGVNPVGLI